MNMNNILKKPLYAYISPTLLRGSLYKNTQHIVPHAWRQLRTELAEILNPIFTLIKEGLGAAIDEEDVDSKWPAVRLECFRELGWALFYMNYLYEEWPADQDKRVEALCVEAARNRSTPSLVYWKQLRERIIDEIENMC